MVKIISPDKKKCIWMETGVVSKKYCDNDFDCQTCNYDDKMQIMVERQKARQEFSQSWVEKMMTLPAHRRKCRYMLTGEVVRKICPNAYECGNCEYDQIMQRG